MDPSLFGLAIDRIRVDADQVRQQGKGPDNPNDRPFRVGSKNMAETMQLLVEYGGLDKASAGKVEDYYTNDYLP